MLTEKQKLFCKEFMVDLNATQAALRAGYSENCATEQGYENLRKPHIQEHLQQLLKERSERTQITADQVLCELSKIAFCDLTKYCKAKNGVVEIIDTDKIPEDQRSIISEISQTQTGIRVKLHDKLRSLELLGKHLGMFQDAETLRKIEELEKLINGGMT